MNTKELYDDFLDLYRGKGKSMTESLICFGFECGDDWFKVIYDFSLNITTYCIDNKLNIPEVLQVKEKLGSLRFYIDSGDDTIYDLINEASKLTPIGVDL